MDLSAFDFYPNLKSFSYDHSTSQFFGVFFVLLEIMMEINHFASKRYFPSFSTLQRQLFFSVLSRLSIPWPKTSLGYLLLKTGN